MRPEELAEALRLLLRIDANVEGMRLDMGHMKRSLRATEDSVIGARLDLAAISRTAGRISAALDRIDARFDAIGRRAGPACPPCGAMDRAH